MSGVHLLVLSDVYAVEENVGGCRMVGAAQWTLKCNRVMAQRRSAMSEWYVPGETCILYGAGWAVFGVVVGWVARMVLIEFDRKTKRGE